MKKLLWRLLLLKSFVSMVLCHTDFTPVSCLGAHNELRRLHVNTNDVTYSETLEIDAQAYAKRLADGETVTDTRPTRVMPKRRKRHVDDRDPNRHIESWDGEIYYPTATWDRNQGRQIKVGENIHKFCCVSAPHCPKEFFHNLHFPPTAKGVVKDWYNEEIGNYDFSSGTKNKEFSQISHFTNIAWKKTTKIGCAQSAVQNNCVYTVVLYEEEGSIGTAENFKQNIGALKSDSSSDTMILTIFLIIFFIVLIFGAILLCYCCRDNIQEKYLEVKIKTDTMKAEQELETDSTNFWWLRIFKNRKPQRRRTTVSRPKNMSLKERPSIEVVPNSAPQRTRPPTTRIHGHSNAASMAIRYQGISQKPQSVLVRDNYGYDNGVHKPLLAPPRETSAPLLPSGHRVPRNEPSQSNFIRQPSLSGKPPPPPVPLQTSNNRPPLRPPGNPLNAQPSPHAARVPSNAEDRYQPVRRPPPPLSKVPSNPLPKPSPPSKTANTPPKMPMMPDKPSPKPNIRPFSVPVNQPPKQSTAPRKNTAPVEESSPSPSVSELRSALNKRESSPGMGRAKPVRPQPQPRPLPSNNSHDHENPSSKSVAEMRKLLEN